MCEWGVRALGILRKTKKMNGEGYAKGLTKEAYVHVECVSQMCISLMRLKFIRR